MINDVAIRGGTVLVGPECTPRRVDVGIADGKLVEVGVAGPARKTLDATGRIVSPGFIDIHTHSDFTIPIYRTAEAKLRQGVTTDVTGNCGFSPFPLENDHVGRHHGTFFEPALTERWPSVLDYAAELESAGIGINVAPLVGLGAIRVAAMGTDQRAPRPKELATMKSMLCTALEQGAFGASSGLVYAPGSYADVGELSEMASVIAKFEAIYTTHIRSEADGLESAIAEALRTSEQSGCSLQISHLKALGKPNWGAIGPALDQIESARERGQDVWVDVYPYTAGSTSLATLLPPSDLAGGESALRERLADPHERQRMTGAVANNPMVSLEDILLAHIPSRPELSGKRLLAAAEEDGVSAGEMVIALVESDGREAVMVLFGISEDDVRSVLRYPQSVVASDGWAMSASASSYTHPRSFAYSARLLAHYVRDEKVLTLSEAIQKLSVFPARRIRDRTRGTLEIGKAADVTIFDLDGVAEVADFAQPCAYPTGFDHVLVGGAIAVEDGEVTDALGGRVLNRRSI